MHGKEIRKSKKTHAFLWENGLFGFLAVSLSGFDINCHLIEQFCIHLGNKTDGFCPDVFNLIIVRPCVASLTLKTPNPLSTKTIETNIFYRIYYQM